MTKKTAIKVVLALVLGIGAGSATLLQARTAHAAGCYGSSCNFQDPNNMGCASTATDKGTFEVDYDFYRLNIVYTELRYSSACNAYWIRSTLQKTCIEADCSFGNVTNFGATWHDLVTDYGSYADSGQIYIGSIAYTTMFADLGGHSVEWCGYFWTDRNEYKHACHTGTF